MADTESMNTENSGSDVQEAKWYVAHTYSGYENKVKVNLEKTIANIHLEDTILEVRIPVQEVVETTGTDEGEADKIEYTEEGERKPQKKKKILRLLEIIPKRKREVVNLSRQKKKKSPRR